MSFFAGVTLICLLLALLKTMRIITPHRPASFLKLSIHYLSVLSLAAVGYFFLQIFNHATLPLYYVGLAIALIIVYARFIEPQIIRVKYHRIQFLSSTVEKPLKLALLSDLHIGIFTHPRQIKRAVKKLKKLPVDAVLIAGDLTYEPTPKQLTKAFLPFKQLNTPIYAVMGNHDEETPGAKVNTLLSAALEHSHIQLIENHTVSIRGIRLYGVGDLWAHKTNFSRLESREPAIILAHHPKTAHYLPHDQKSSLLLAGHTHGGQINIPILSKTIIRYKLLEGYLQGEYQHQQHKIFVSKGIGTVGIPFRLGMPPTVDILEIH